jgi:hypothetical protein
VNDELDAGTRNAVVTGAPRMQCKRSYRFLSSRQQPVNRSLIELHIPAYEPGVFPVIIGTLDIDPTPLADQDVTRPR